MIAKKDGQFFHDLTIRDARKHLPTLRDIAKKEHPTLAPTDLVIRVDYVQLPPVFRLAALDTYSTGPTNATVNAEARNDAIIEKVRENRENYTLLESAVASGQSITCVLTLATGSFWTSDEHPTGGRECRCGCAKDDEDADLGERKGKNADDVDMMRARNVINRVLTQMGEDSVF